MSWDPDRYLRFADHRTRPGLELIARIPDTNPRTIVDLGCGTGHLTAVLAERWPGARVEGIDNSPEMVERAKKEHPQLAWTLADIGHWDPEKPVDLLFSNAAFHWLENHNEYFANLRARVARRGVIAVQMPDNWQAPTHRVPARILDTGDWPPAARSALLRDRVSNPAVYRQWLQPAEVEMWRTTYFQTLTGDDAVWTWVTGSVLRPVLAALSGDERDRFTEICKAQYAEAYPQQADGTTLLEFSRLFFVARMP